MGKASRRKAGNRSRVAAARRRSSPSAWALRAAVGLAVIVGVVLVVSSRGGDGPVAAPTGTREIEVPGANHVTEDVDYPESPPVGGNHDPAWQNCGSYPEPVRDENAVHSMEHGTVWITYRPDLGDGQIKTLAGKARGQTHVLVSPREDLESPIVLSAWGRQLGVDSPNDDRVDQFIRAFQEGPQAPELGAPCSGGIGSPE